MFVGYAYVTRLFPVDDPLVYLRFVKKVKTTKEQKKCSTRAALKLLKKDRKSLTNYLFIEKLRQVNAAKLDEV